MGVGENSIFYRFTGWRIYALLAVFIAYTLWYVGPGYFGQLTALPGHISLQESGFYDGASAVERLGQLDAAGRKTKYLALLFDGPYMFLQTLVFGAVIAFGLRHMKLTATKWRYLLAFAPAFLLADFLEDSFIALTLKTGSESLGTVAGLMTAVKFATFIPAILISLVMLVGGLIAWWRGRSKNSGS